MVRPKTAMTAGVRPVEVTPMRPRGQIPVKAVGSFVPKLTRKAFEKYGFSAAALLTDWSAIVGADLARFTVPERLKWPKGVDAYGEVEADSSGRPGATLILRVDGGRALEIEYGRRELIDRINGYFGYRAVAELRILQAPIAALSMPPLRRAVRSPAVRQTPSATAPAIAAIADEGLRAALERMQAGIAASSQPHAR